MPLRAYPPGTRKSNKTYIFRGSVDGELVEFTTPFQAGTDPSVINEALRFSEAEIIQGRRRTGPYRRGRETRREAENHASAATLDIARIYQLSQNVECGVYFLFQVGRLQYIGQSVRVRTRITEHRAEARIPFDHWAALDLPAEVLDFVEAAHILRYRPPYNRGTRLRQTSVSRPSNRASPKLNHRRGSRGLISPNNNGETTRT